LLSDPSAVPPEHFPLRANFRTGDGPNRGWWFSVPSNSSRQVAEMLDELGYAYGTRRVHNLDDNLAVPSVEGDGHD
jgi:hypothetical protein